MVLHFIMVIFLTLCNTHFTWFNDLALLFNTNSTYSEKGDQILHHDRQFVTIIMNIMFTFLFFRLIILFNYICKLFSFNLLWCVTVIVSLGGAAIFTEALQSISICKEALPLCLTFVTRVFIVFCHHDWVYSGQKCL